MLKSVEKPPNCPNCGENKSELIHLDVGTKLRLKETGAIEDAPDFLCESCLRNANKSMSQGAKLRAEQEAKEQNRIMLWKNRIGFVKQGRQLLAEKNYSDAAVSFEKYLRSIEIVFEKSSGELTSEMFKDEAQKKELTILASVYWDLLRIYDSSPRYRERQMKAAEKLADFARFTPVYPNLIRQAEKQLKAAKNSEAYEIFLRKSNALRPRCFIATAAFSGYQSPTVISLCRFRDESLRKSQLGRAFIVSYYRISPSIAKTLDRNQWAKPLTRVLLRAIARCVVKKSLESRARLVQR